MKFYPLSAENTLYIVCAVWLVLFAIASLDIALFNPLHNHDGYTFLMQARALTDMTLPGGIYWERPRALVMILSLFDRGYLGLLGRYPKLSEYHPLMVVISLSFLGIWWAVLKRLLGNVAATLGILFLLVHRTYLQMTPVLLADILAGLFWGITVWLMMELLQTLDRSRGGVRSALLSTFIGISGALAGLSKNQIFNFLPTFVFVFLATLWGVAKPTKQLRRKSLLWMGDILLTGAVVIDLMHRFFGDKHQGFVAYCRYLLIKTRWALESQPMTPKDVYPLDLLESYGALFWILIVLFLLLGFRRCRSLFQGKVDASKRVATITLCVLTVIFLVQNQRIPNLEPRYILPFLPAVFGLIAWICHLVWLQLPQKLQKISVALFFVALIHPVRTQFGEYRSLRNQKMWVPHHEDEKLWAYIEEPITEEIYCRPIYGCQAAEPKYQLDASRFAFFHGFFPVVRDCGTKSRDYGELRRQLSAETLPNACYLLRLVPKEAGYPNTIVVLKTIGSRLLPKEADDLQKKTSSDGQFIFCEKAENQLLNCFRGKKFFGDRRVGGS